MERAAARAWWARPELAIPGIYVAAAGTWALLSGDLIARRAHVPPLFERLEVGNDLLFIAVTAVLLHLGIRAAVKRTRDLAQRLLDAERRYGAEMRQLAERLLTAREEEQVRIARDLHDDLGQLVTSLTLAIHGGQKVAAGLAPGPATARLAELGQLSMSIAREIQSSIQRISADLRPTPLEELAVGAALRRELRRLEGQCGWSASLHLSPGLDAIPGPVGTALFRIGMEALTNVARHAGARTVEVTLRLDEGDVVLEVGDDGVGPGLAGSASLGLLGMNERAAALGGEVTLRPGSPRGTTVTARIPLAPGLREVAS